MDASLIVHTNSKKSPSMIDSIQTKIDFTKPANIALVILSLTEFVTIIVFLSRYPTATLKEMMIYSIIILLAILFKTILSVWSCIKHGSFNFHFYFPVKGLFWLLIALIINVGLIVTVCFLISYIVEQQKNEDENVDFSKIEHTKNALGYAIFSIFILEILGWSYSRLKKKADSNPKPMFVLNT